jgi:uncharacterized protein
VPVHQPVTRAPFKWRKWNNILHRDIGYVIVGLTIVYAVSGIAVNHAADWNPNYTVERRGLEIGPLDGTTREELVVQARERLTLSEEPRTVFRPDPETLQLFYDRTTYAIDVPTGKVIVESVQPRRVLFEFNQLHLNAPKRIWTYIADAYALSLIIVVITGMFVLKGKTGIVGRGAWFVSLGVVIPLLYWLFDLFAF